MMAFQTKNAVPLKFVDTNEALAVAFAAYRIRKGYQKHTQRFSEDKATEHSNKEMVKFYFNAKSEQYVDHDFVMFKPTEEDYASVAEARKWLKRYVMLGLDDNIDDFKKDMLESVKQDTVPVNNLGRIAFIPEFVKRDRHETGLKKEIRIEYRNSQYLGKEKDVVDCVVKILDSRYSNQWESYNYTAVDMEGNLVSFMNKYEHPIGTMKHIKAKVKSQTKNKLFDANETRLNYVKLYKV
jgi:hypothetical protein